MISLYSGTPGSGKSLHCARTIQNWSRLGYPVIGNFPVDLSKYKRAAFTYCPNEKLTPDFLIQYSRNFFGSKPIKEGSILLVVDECQLVFNAREWQQSGRARWLSFFTQHRHYGYDIILIAQFDRMVDRQIRSLIEYEYIHRKMSNFGWQGKALSLVFGGKSFISVKMWYPLNEKIGSEIFHARKSLYSIYDSYAILDEAKPITDESQTEEEAAEAVPVPASKAAGVLDMKRASPLFKLRGKNSKKEKRHLPCRLDGSYLRPWSGRKLLSLNGKYLRPGGRSETGWS